jgi:hypothetical protein
MIQKPDDSALAHIDDGPKISVLSGGTAALLRRVAREPDAAGHPVRLFYSGGYPGAYTQWPDLTTAAAGIPAERAPVPLPTVADMAMTTRDQLLLQLADLLLSVSRAHVRAKLKKSIVAMIVIRAADPDHAANLPFAPRGVSTSPEVSGTSSKLCASPREAASPFAVSSAPSHGRVPSGSVQPTMTIPRCAGI